MQPAQELGQLLPGCVPIDRIDDLEQRGTFHPSRHKKNRVDAAGDYLGQEGNPTVALQGGQDSDFVGEAFRGRS